MEIWALLFGRVSRHLREPSACWEGLYLEAVGLGSLGALSCVLLRASVLWPPVLDMEEAESDFCDSVGGQMVLL